MDTESFTILLSLSCTTSHPWVSLNASRADQCGAGRNRTKGPLQKKDTSVTFWAERIFFCHTYDNNCDKTWYHHRCGGLVLLWQKIMTENGFSSWAGRRCRCMTFFGPSMTEKTMVEARAWKISGIATVFEGKVFNLNLLIRHKRSQRILSSISSWVVNSTPPGNLVSAAKYLVAN